MRKGSRGILPGIKRRVPSSSNSARLDNKRMIPGNRNHPFVSFVPKLVPFGQAMVETAATSSTQKTSCFQYFAVFLQRVQFVPFFVPPTGSGKHLVQHVDLLLRPRCRIGVGMIGRVQVLMSDLCTNEIRVNAAVHKLGDVGLPDFVR